MTDEATRLRAAYLAGFKVSGEGCNGEYPYGDKNQNPEADAHWCKERDDDLLAITPQSTGRTDSERLAFLDVHLATLQYRLHEQWCVFSGSQIIGRGATIQTAIDAAMDSAKGGE